MLYMLCFTLSKGCKWKRSVVWTYKHWYIAQVIFFYGKMKFIHVGITWEWANENVYFWVNKSCSILTGFGWWLLPASSCWGQSTTFKFLWCPSSLGEEVWLCLYLMWAPSDIECCNWPDCCCFCGLWSVPCHWQTLRGAVEAAEFMYHVPSRLPEPTGSSIFIVLVVHCCRPPSSRLAFLIQCLLWVARTSL